jgi:DNA-directed RNA polymerase alpha subunit
MFCLERNVDNSQGLEDLIREYFELKDKQEQEAPNLKTPDRTPDPQPSTPEPAEIPIEELQLSVRGYNCLKRAQINSVAELLTHTPQTLLAIQNVGQSTVDEVVARLQKLGFSLAPEPEPEPAEPETTAKPTAATKPAAATAKRGKANKGAS